MILLLPFALAAPPTVAASAEPPPPPTAAQVERWSATEYNDYLVDNGVEVVRAMQAEIDAFVANPSEEAYHSYETGLKAVVHKGRVDVGLLPGWHNDTRMREALVSGYDTQIRFFDVDLPRIWELSTRPDVRDADLAALEATIVKAEATGRQVDEAIRDAQKAFAKKNNFILIEVDREEPPERPTFTAPGIPPEGSRLSGDVHVGFAMRYHNRVVEHETAMVTAMNDFLGATNGEDGALEAARKAARDKVLAEKKLVEAGEPWQGDDSLRLGLLEVASLVERLLADDFSDYVKLRNKARHSREDVDTINRIASESSPRFQATLDGFIAAQAAFQERWGLRAYAAWAAARPPG